MNGTFFFFFLFSKIVIRLGACGSLPFTSDMWLAGGPKQVVNAYARNVYVPQRLTAWSQKLKGGSYGWGMASWDLLRGTLVAEGVVLMAIDTLFTIVRT